MITYIFNTNFLNEDDVQYIEKQREYMNDIDGQVVISSFKGNYNYNNQLSYTKPHYKSLYLGNYIEDPFGNVLVDKPLDKIKALFASSLYEDDDIYIIANNGFFTNGRFFNDFIKNEDQDDSKGLYELNKIYLVFIKGDIRDQVLLKDYQITYFKKYNYSIISKNKIEPEEVLKFLKGFTICYSDSFFDTKLLQSVNEGYAIGNKFDILQLGSDVERVTNFFFLNKYIEKLLKAEND